MWWLIGGASWLAAALLACWAVARIGAARKPHRDVLTDEEILAWTFLREAYDDEAGTEAVAAQEWAAEQLMREAL